MVKSLYAFGAGFVVALGMVGFQYLTPAEANNPELQKICDADQEDRKPATMDWEAVSLRDEKRLARVKEIFTSGEVNTTQDLFNAALVLQHGTEPDDYLLSHELSVAALALSAKNHQAAWLAAASEDRFLMNLKRPQRFGTQFRSEGLNKPMLLHEVAPVVTDQLRKWMSTPSLADAKKREAEYNKGG